MWQAEGSVSEFQGTGGMLRLYMKLMIIIPWFLGIKVGDNKLENWGVGCVCKSFALRFR